MSISRISWNFAHMTSDDVTMTQNDVFFQSKVVFPVLKSSAISSLRYYTCKYLLTNHCDSHRFGHSTKVKVKGQGHFMVISRPRRNRYFFSRFDGICFNVCGKIAYMQAPSRLVFGGNRARPMGFNQGPKN